jgi:hypothetical protein
VEAAAFNEAMGRKLDRTEFTSFQTRVDQALNTRVTVADFNAALAAKTDVAAFNSFRDQTNRALETKVDRPRFDAFANTVNTELGTLRESNRTLSTSVGAIERRIRVLPGPPNP